MLREYVVRLLEERYPQPMGTAKDLVDDYGIVRFLEEHDIQEELLNSWRPHEQDLPDPYSLDLDDVWQRTFSHRWYLKKFLITIQRNVKLGKQTELARIHSMMLDLNDKELASLRAFLADYHGYIRWQLRFCEEQYQISFRPQGV